MGSVGNSKIASAFQTIATQNIPIERAYYDISDSFADEVFNTYDPADLYSYLTLKEQRAAYRDLQGINATNKQAQYEWKKKAIWRIAKKKAWNELEVY